MTAEREQGRSLARGVSRPGTSVNTPLSTSHARVVDETQGHENGFMKTFTREPVVPIIIFATSR